MGPEFREELKHYERERDRQAVRTRQCDPFRWILWIAVTICVLLSILVIVLVIIYVTDDNDPKPVGSCGGCHCVADRFGTCPEKVQESDYSSEFISTLKKQKALNAVEMPPCDPYMDNDCDLDSPQGDFGSTSVCGIHYEDSYCTSYKLRTYPNQDLALEEGAFVTHVGPCGVCSTTQDLAALLSNVDMTTASENCEVKSAAGQSKGRQCFEGLGLSSSCANMWAHAARQNERHCAVKCVVSDLRDIAYQGGAPTCSLNACLRCNADHSQGTFEKFAGRTSQSSGVLSSIAQPCSDLAHITQSVCPSTRPLLE